MAVPIIGNDGTIYLTTGDTPENLKTIALNSGLTKKWEAELDDTSRVKWSAPALCPDGSVVTGSPQGYVHKVPANGNVL